MEFTFFIGTDVSKNELDFALMQGKQLLFHREIENKVKAIQAFIAYRIAGLRSEQSCVLHGAYRHLQ